MRPLAVRTLTVAPAFTVTGSRHTLCPSFIEYSVGSSFWNADMSSIPLDSSCSLRRPLTSAMGLTSVKGLPETHRAFNVGH